jgi:hypothetical protein
MKKNILYLVSVLAMGIIFTGCGGGDSSNSTGTISMNVTDAKPMLPVSGTVESVSITFDEVSVHKSGGGWVTLNTAKQPYTIDLYQFSDGTKTQFVPPVQLESGKYTQVRIGVMSATIQIKENDVSKTVNLEIPSENLKTDKNFEFDVQGGGAVDLTVDFDLSQSIVVTGSGTYQLKPVLHIVQTQEAATINGKIKDTTFGNNTQAIVVVTLDRDNSETITTGDEEYTRITVDKSLSGDTQFSIFWVVPNNGYVVQIEIGGVVIYTEAITLAKMAAGAVLSLNGGNAI